MKAYKAFYPDMTCRGFQYEIGQTDLRNGRRTNQMRTWIPCVSGVT